MQESIIVIFIVTIIIGIALFVFYQLQINSIENTKTELEQNRDILLLSTLKNNPILSYTYLGTEENALDTIKLLNNNLVNLGNKEIIIKQVYPDVKDITCTKQNYPDCNKYVVYSKKPVKITNTQIISTPVLLYFPYTDEYYPGTLEIRSYS